MSKIKDSKVYIVNKGCHDYSAAKRFGELIYLSKGMYHLLAVGKMMREFNVFLKHSKQDDLILLCGANVMNVVATSLFMAKHGRVNLLIYTNQPGKQGSYKVRTIVLENEDE